MLVVQWVPVNRMALTEYPALAHVGVNPPESTKTASWKFDAGFTRSNSTTRIAGAHEYGSSKALMMRLSTTGLVEDVWGIDDLSRFR